MPPLLRTSTVAGRRGSKAAAMMSENGVGDVVKRAQLHCRLDSANFRKDVALTSTPTVTPTPTARVLLIPTRNPCPDPNPHTLSPRWEHTEKVLCLVCECGERIRHGGKRDTGGRGSDQVAGKQAEKGGKGWQRTEDLPEYQAPMYWGLPMSLATCVHRKERWSKVGAFEPTPFQPKDRPHRFSSRLDLVLPVVGHTQVVDPVLTEPEGVRVTVRLRGVGLKGLG